MTKLTPQEKKLVEHAKRAVVKYNKMRHSKGGIDTLYAFIISNTGKIYDGACLETYVQHANVCGERHAIANMIMSESYKAKVKAVVVADPVPREQKTGTMPCGSCRHLLWEFGTPKTSVIALQYIQIKKEKNLSWVFPKFDKYTIQQLYPKAYKPVVWD